MRKYLMITLVFFVASSMLFGCSVEDSSNNADDNTKMTKDIVLIFGDVNYENFVEEESKVTYFKEDNIYKVILEKLIEGPANIDYRSTINNETNVYGTIKQNSDLIVNLSNEFSKFDGSISEIIAVGSIVNTMTGLENIERVKILIEGEELIGPSGEPRGFMETIKNNDMIEPETKEITLYFGNLDGTAVVAENRTIILEINSNREEFFKRTVEELIIGPSESNLSKTIPKEVKVLSVVLEKNIVYVDFSNEMHTKHWGGATGEAMTIASIVSTLTEFYDIDQVMMTVEGNPLAIEHMILEEPLSRNEEMIQK